MSKTPSAPQGQYLPIATAIPAFAEVQSMQPPNAFAQAIPADVWGVLEATNDFAIRQHVKVLPKTCCSCPPCVKQENTYSVYAGVRQDAMAEFLRIDEVSEDWNRCCCAPYHPVRMEVRPYIPMPGDGSNSDYAHIANDLRNNLGALSIRDRYAAIRDMYKQHPPVMTMIRHDGQRCCCKMPCKWLSTFVCFNCCQDGMSLYAGALEDEPNGEKGRPYNLDPSRLIGSVTQPVFGGWIRPTLHLRGEGQTEEAQPYAKVEGPCFFGGWSEMCCDFNFFLSNFTSDTKAGDIGRIVKRKPQSVMGALQELMTNSDNYAININEGVKLSAGQKATVLTAQILADYMFFDGNTEKCSQDDNNIYCYCCYFSCIGMLCPVYIAIPKNAGN